MREPCQACGERPSHARNYCRRCYQYWHQHGVERPRGLDPQAGNRAGGLSLVARRGVEHMRAIGRLGGQVTSADHAHMADIGHVGGQVTSADHDHMARIGRVGGAQRPNAARHEEAQGGGTAPGQN